MSSGLEGQALRQSPASCLRATAVLVEGFFFHFDTNQDSSFELEFTYGFGGERPLGRVPARAGMAVARPASGFLAASISLILSVGGDQMMI